MSKSLWEIYYSVRDFIKNMKSENLSAYASSTAFFIFVSLVPMLLLICAIIPFTPLTKENLIKILADVVPVRMEGLVENIIENVYIRSAGVLSVAVILILWSAGKGVLAVVRGLNAVNDVEEERNYFVVRIYASFYTLILLLIVLVSMIILVFGNQLVRMLISISPKLRLLFSLLLNLRFLFVWILLTVIFAAFYAYLPNKKLTFKAQLPGASFAAVIWSIFSWCFSIYVSWGNGFNIYGSLSIIVVLLLWLYFCFYIIFMGAYINKRME